MPILMEHFDEIDVEGLHEALASVEEQTPIQRLLAAVAFKGGVT